MAVNWMLVPFAIDGLTGVTWIETSVAPVTVNTVDANRPPNVALIVVVPTPAACARPCEPLALEIVATAPLLDAHVDCVVTSCVELSLNVAIAVNWTFVPFAALGVVGVTCSETSVAGFTVRIVEPLMLPNVAEIVDWPTACAVATPCVPVAFEIVATLVVDEAHVTCVVRSCVELSV